MRRGDMIGVAGQAVADHFGIDIGAARLGLLIFLEHDYAGAFAHDEAVAVDVIGPAGALGFVVEIGRKRAGLGKAGDADRANRRFGAAGEHDVGIVDRDHPRGVADRVGTGRAGGDDGVVGAHQAIFDRDLARDEIDQPAVDEMRADPARPVFVEDDRFGFNPGQAADARADRDASAQPLFLAHVGETGILDRLAGGVDAVDDERVDLALDLVIHPLARIEAIFMVGRLQLAGDLAGIVARDRTG